MGKMAEGSGTLILYNGKIYVERGNFAEAVFVRGDTIEAVGGNDEIKNMAGADTRMIDCGGRTVVPGFNDSHMHLSLRAVSELECKITDVSSIEDMIGRCRAFLDGHPERAKRGIHAIGWNQDLFTSGEKRMPDRRDLDRISTDVPVVLERICGHIVSANTKAMEVLGVTKDTVIDGGDIYKDADGEPSGLFTENATGFIRRAVPEFTAEELAASVKSSMDFCLAHGLTSVQSNDATETPEQNAEIFNMYRGIYSSGEAKLRLHHQVCFKSADDLARSFEDGEYANRAKLYPGSYLTLGPLKVFRDGSLGARTALMKHGYADDPNAEGCEWSTKEEFEALCRCANEHGLQVVTHCIGDKGIQDVIDVYEKLEPVPGENPLRNCLIHCQITDSGMLEQIKDLGILVSAQPVFLDYDMHIVEDRAGKELARTSYAFGTLKRSGVHISFGTDCPVEECAPLPNIYYAVTRCDKNGYPAGGFVPSEKIDIYDAVDCATIESAYMQFMEDRKGRIKKGYLADMVVLDKDIFTCDPMEIKDIGVDMTIVGGEVAYER